MFISKSGDLTIPGLEPSASTQDCQYASSAPFTHYIAGQYEVSVSIAEADISQVRPSSTLTVKAAELSVPNSTLVAFSRNTVAGRTNLVTATAYDKYGNIRDGETFSDVMTVTLHCPAHVQPPNQCVEPTVVSRWDTESQSFRSQFAATTAGQYTVNVFLREDTDRGAPAASAELTGSPYSLTVAPEVCCLHGDPSHCTLKNFELQQPGQSAQPGAEGGIVHAGLLENNVASFRVVDRYGNVRYNNDSIGIGSLMNIDPEVATNPPIVSYEWNENTADYDIFFKSNISALKPWTFTLDISGAALPCSDHCGVGDSLDSFAVLIRPDALSLERSESSLRFGVTEAGRLAEFTVMPRDQFGNLRDRVGFELSDTISVLLVGPHLGSAAPERSETSKTLTEPSRQIQWSPTGFGVSFTVTIAGQYSVTVQLGDLKKTHSPSAVSVEPDWGHHDFEVRPDQLSPVDSYVTKGPYHTTVPANMTWVVIAFDKFGNRRGTNNDTMTVEVTKSTSTDDSMQLCHGAVGGNATHSSENELASNDCSSMSLPAISGGTGVACAGVPCTASDTLKPRCTAVLVSHCCCDSTTSGADPCFSSPCLNGGQCSAISDTYMCTCAFDQWFGDNCETSENDCLTMGGTMICENEGETCVDCARTIANPIPGGYPQRRENPDCQKGYTCDAAPAQMTGTTVPATGCVDDPDCSEMFLPVSEAFNTPKHTGVPCAMWPLADLAVMGLPQGKTMQTYCPTRCREPQCLNGGGGTTPPGGGDPCKPNPCLNQGQCGTHALDPTIAAGTYRCQCSATFFGLTCETNEDDCGIGGKAATCGAQACVDCLRGAYQGYTYVPDPACEDGYTCGEVAGAACTDDPRCGSGQIDWLFAQNKKACATWQPHVMATVTSMLVGMGVPAGTTLETLCPARCDTPACLEFDECASAPCQNGGECADSSTQLFENAIAAGSYFCRCDKHHFGDNCEASEDDCGVGGGDATCVAQGMTCTDCSRGKYVKYTYVPNKDGTCAAQGYKCVASGGGGHRRSQENTPCPPSASQCSSTDTFAPRCNDTVTTGCCCERNECLSSPCLNGGLCVSLADGTHKCNCAFDQWYGEKCETSENDCLTRGGTMTCESEKETCVDCARTLPGSAGYPVANSACPQGYRCEAASSAPCASAPCLNGGHCADSTTDAVLARDAGAAGLYQCKCYSWYGDNCETSEDDCGAGGTAEECAASGKTCVDCERGHYEGYTYVPNPECHQGYTCKTGEIKHTPGAGTGPHEQLSPCQNLSAHGVPCSKANMSVAVTPGPMGEYTVRFATSVSGPMPGVTYKTHISISGVYASGKFVALHELHEQGSTASHEQDSPYSVTVAPGPGSLARHIINGCLLLDDRSCWVYQREKLTMSEQNNLIEVTLRDAYDNLVAGNVTAASLGNDGVTISTYSIDDRPIVHEIAVPQYHIHHQYHAKNGIYMSSLPGYSVCLSIDNDANVSCLRYKYAIRTSVNQSHCDSCDDYFNSTVQLAEDDIAGCKNSGCLFPACETNTVTLTLASGYWATDNSISVTNGWLNVSESHFDVTLTLTRQRGPSPKCGNNFGADTGDNTSVYWWCNTVQNESWYEEVPTTLLKRTTTTDDRINISFEVKHAGFWLMKILVKEVSVGQQNPASSAPAILPTVDDIKLPPMSILISPGRISFETSILATPIRTASYQYSINGGGHGVEKIGPSLIEGPNQPKFPDVKMLFRAKLRDESFSGRWGRDRVRMALCHSNGKLIQEFQDVGALSASSIDTAGIHAVEFRFNPDVGLSNPDNPIQFNPKSDPGFGEFWLRTWVCSFEDVRRRRCAEPTEAQLCDGAEATGENSIVYFESVDKTAQLWSTSTIKDYPTAVVKTNMEVGNKKGDKLIFTICPANSFTSNGDWRGLYGTGFTEGRNLDTCQCISGYHGERGSYCSACPAGKFKKNEGNVPCSDCSIGMYSSCSSTEVNSCGPQGEPAISVCTKCEIGRYQNRQGMSNCDGCLSGYLCKYQGMNYPVASTGYWISPIDPKQLSRCEYGDVACPGGNFTAEAELRNAGDPCTKEKMSNEASQNSLGSLGIAENFAGNCREAMGSQCLRGYAVVPGAGCDTCCKRPNGPSDHPDGSQCSPDPNNPDDPGDVSYFMSNRECHPCKGSSKLAVAVMVLFGLTIIAPVGLKLGEAFQHAGSLQAPVMSLINFMQSASLFRYLDLKWPQGFKDFCHQVKSPKLLEHHTCSVRPWERC
jgi:hypothetical protein